MDKSLEYAVETSPYPSLRESQQKGIETAQSVLKDNGYFVLEGECGTGKTLLSLLSMLEDIDNGVMDRIVATTSVKQQMEIFEEEMRSINDVRREQGKDPFFVVTLKGKGDLCPYVKHGAIDFSEIQTECSKLRKGTRRKLDSAESKVGGAKKLQQMEKTPHGSTQYDSTGVYEYPFEVVEAPEGDHCPFYAGYLEEMYNAMEEDGYDPEDVIPFDISSAGVISIEDMITHAGSAGMCPHSILGEAMECADVVIGNYRHIFDEQTRHFTEELISPSTYLVVDEAHNLVSNVRDTYSYQKTFNGFSHNIEELNAVNAMISDTINEQWDDSSDLASNVKFLMSGSQATDAVELLRGMRDKSANAYVDGGFSASKSTLDDLSVETVLTEFTNALTEFHEKAADYIESQVDWQNTDEYNFQDPEQLSADNFTQWIDLKGYSHIFKDLDEFGELVTYIEDALSLNYMDESTVESGVEEMCTFFSKWYNSPSNRYFRVGEIEKRDRTVSAHTQYHRKWTESYRFTLHVRNCLPRDEIHETLSELGGGILMSATLSPLDKFVQEVGLSLFDDRSVTTEQFPLPFPEENRLSATISANKFKWSNRGSAWDDTSGNSWDNNQTPNLNNETRKQYANIITSTVKETPGNVLIVMPSYIEAAWASEIVSNETGVTESEIYTDSSTQSSETQELKEDFFSEESGVLITGALGTLTEGIDYSEDRLHGVLVCGVPIVNTNTDYHTAIQTTYDDEFEDDGYHFAFVVPAVRKSRQAIGRVIRGSTETGVRILADQRYCQSHKSEWDTVYPELPDSLQDEITEISTDEIESTLQTFWKSVSV